MDFGWLEEIPFTQRGSSATVKKCLWVIENKDRGIERFKGGISIEIVFQPDRIDVQESAKVYHGGRPWILYDECLGS